MIRKNKIDAEIMAECGQWEAWVTLVFIHCINARYGHWEHLPFVGGVMDQPVFVMLILSIMRSEYLVYLKEVSKPTNQID